MLKSPPTIQPVFKSSASGTHHLQLVYRSTMSWTSYDFESRDTWQTMKARHGGIAQSRCLLGCIWWASPGWLSEGNVHISLYCHIESIRKSEHLSGWQRVEDYPIQSCCPSCFIKCVLDRGAGKETSEMVSNQARQKHSMSVSAWYKSLSFSNGSRCFQSRKAALCSIQKQKMDCFHCFTHCKALIFNHLWCSYCISHKSNHTRLTRELMTILFIFQISPEFSNVQRVFVGSFVDHPSTIFVGKKKQTCQPLPTISPSIWSWHLNWTMRWSQIFSGQVSWDIQAVQVSF